MKKRIRLANLFWLRDLRNRIFGEDLPEEEQVIIEAVDALNVFSTEKVEYGENLDWGIFWGNWWQKNFQNDLLIIKLFLFKCLMRVKIKSDAMIFSW